MKACKFVYAVLVAIVAGTAALYAQSDPYLEWSGVYSVYRRAEGPGLTIPRGYKAFYISHIGRHGSRYPVNEAYVRNGLDPLLRADSLGVLSAEGKRLLADFLWLHEASNGTYGLIDARGAAEHQAIASRMAANFPEVFRGRDSICCYSTHKQRAMLSMTNFASSLAARIPAAVRIGFVAGEKYYDYLCAEDKASSGLKLGSRKSDSATARQFDYGTFFPRIFTDVDAGLSCIRSKRLMVETIYTNGTVADYLGRPQLMRHLTPEEYRTVSRIYNAKMYCQHCNSEEQGEWRTHIMDPLLRDFVARADAALGYVPEGQETVAAPIPVGSGCGRIAADLRFSHDVGMMPFFALIGLQGYDSCVSFEQASDVWNSTGMMPMATNLQLVFCRNRKGSVKVGLLFNEAATSIPALGPGPFYDWPALRSYLLSRLARQ